jgi:hypothetical protein
MSRQKRRTTVPRLRVSPNAESLMRSLLATCDPASLRRLASSAAGRTELERLQRVAAARAAEFEDYLRLARDVGATLDDALKSTLEA